MKRSAPLRRTPLRRARPEGPTLDREPKPWAPPTLAPLVRGTYAGGTSGAVPKDPVKAKPGKRTPTKEEREWMDSIVRYGCVACRLDGMEPRPTAVHHILSGGRRMGHLFTLGLCDPGHHQNGAQFGMVSRHPNKAAFEEVYGPEMQLLGWLRGEIGATP